MSTQLQLNVFGPPELVLSGSPIRFRTKKHLAVLLYLHYEGRARAVSRDRLADLLWPDVPPAKGRHSLSQALLAIRSHLGNDAVLGHEDDVQLRAELAADLTALKNDAEPLQGLEDCGSAEFSHWVDGVRARLRSQARDRLREALQAARTKGSTAESQQLAARLYEIDPLCAEAVYVLAERALLERDAVAAARLLKQHVERARSELGTNPNPEIARLLRRLERGERPASAPRTAPVDGETRQREAHAFVAREAELARLEAVAGRVADGGYETCLITGTPGIGKTSLIRRFATALQARAWPVFMVSCQEIGQAIPYATVSELISALVRDPAVGGTDPRWLAEASRVCPGLRSMYPGVPDAPEAPSDAIRLRVAEAVLQMMEAAADNGPALFALDDLQFVDPASREVLFLVTRGLARGRVPLLILGAARIGAEESTSLWRDTIELDSLAGRDALSLIRTLSPSSDETGSRIHETIARLSQGNPYHIEMLVDDWQTHQSESLAAAEATGDATKISWTPPADLRAAFARHYGDLSADAQHVLQVLAVAGRAMAPRDVASMLGFDQGTSERVVLEMLDRGVGRVEHGQLSFKNELHRAYVYHAMEQDRRTYHHAQFAQRLAASNDRNQLHTMLELVHHAMHAGLEQQAVEMAQVAAELAIARGAPHEAERVLTLLLRTFRVAPSSRLRLLLAQALVYVGQYQRGIDALAEWQADGASAEDRALGALIQADARNRGLLGSYAVILGAAEEAVALAQQANATALLVRANYIRMEFTLDAGDLATREQAEAVAARVAASEASPECVALANMALGQIAISRGEPALALARLAAAAPVLESLGLLMEFRRALATMGISYRGLGQFADAARTFRECVNVAERCGHLGSIAHSYGLLGNVYQDLAFFDAATETYRHVVASLEVLDSARAFAEAYS
ncbi:MAG TPA: AAA family ATPase, partial [Gemmatimonadales bacterium]|nr:AAA family ATPase [Gemmatimonadales bacterium]